MQCAIINAVMSFRTWVSIITIALLGLVVFFGWSEIVAAWRLLGQVDLWILALMIPVQIFSYYATGGMIFSYLRAKGNLKDTSHWEMTRMALELNFVNHILPSGGAAGFSYLGWVLGRHGVKPGRATMAQIIRFFLTFVSFVMLLVIAVVIVAVDEGVSRFVLLISAGLVASAVFGSLFLLYIIGSKVRLHMFAGWLTRISNKVVAKFTRGKNKHAVKLAVIEEFFTDLHQDFEEIKSEKKILTKPFIWSIVANIADVALIFIAFWSLGVLVNPAMLLIAFGVASIVSAVSITPGGAGVYEAVMIAFLASAGVEPHMAIAGTLLARVLLMVGTIVFGYAFYQLTLIRYGKSPTKR